MRPRSEDRSALLLLGIVWLRPRCVLTVSVALENLSQPEFCFSVISGLIFPLTVHRFGSILETVIFLVHLRADSSVSVSPGTYCNLSECRLRSFLYQIYL